MPSDNVTSADNQQERQDYYVGWVVGFVDGEGCFSVGVFRNRILKNGWQVFPEFVVTQGAKSRAALEELKTFFGCGKIFVNTRYDNHRESLYRYCVRSTKDIREKIIPFFVQYPLRTAKRDDFLHFVKIIDMMERKIHLTPHGMKTIAKIVQQMNRKKPSQYLESSETIRQTPRARARDTGRYSPISAATQRISRRKAGVIT